MGINGKTALVDANDAIVRDMMGDDVSFLVPNGTLTYDASFNGYDLTLPCYSPTLSFTFFLDPNGVYVSTEVWEDKMSMVLNKEESSVLDEVFLHLVSTGLIEYEASK